LSKTETETHEARPWPVDFDEVEIGRFFSPEELAQIFGVEAESPRFRLLKLALRSSIEKKLKQRDIPLYVRVKDEGDGLRVLDHWANLHHSTKSFRQRYRGMGRDVGYISRIDTSEFDEKQLVIYERNLNECATIYLGAKRAKREALLSNRNAETPKVLSAE
jgi:hypothetical protein